MYLNKRSVSSATALQLYVSLISPAPAPPPPPNLANTDEQRDPCGTPQTADSFSRTGTANDESTGPTVLHRNVCVYNIDK